jgi:hypothetical protein
VRTVILHVNPPRPRSSAPVGSTSSAGESATEGSVAAAASDDERVEPASPNSGTASDQPIREPENIAPEAEQHWTSKLELELSSEGDSGSLQERRPVLAETAETVVAAPAGSGTGPVPSPTRTLVMAAAPTIAQAISPAISLPPTPEKLELAEAPDANRRMRIVAAVAALVVLVAAVAIAVGLRAVSKHVARTLATPSSTAALLPAITSSSSEPIAPIQLAPPPAFSAVDAATDLVARRPVAAPPPSLSAPPPGTGVITVGASRAGHRVWIDDRLMSEQAPAAYVVGCGKHMVQVGSRASPVSLEVPCGATVEAK